MQIASAVAVEDHWVIIVNASKFYFNYRHQVNSLYVYQIVKRLGIPDSNIITMLPENVQCHPRNSYPAEIYDGKTQSNWYKGNIAIDYKGAQVTPDSLLNLLTGRQDPNLPAGKRLGSGKKSKVLVYLNGHGGAGYLKIQDTLVIRTVDIVNAFAEMEQKERYGEMLLLLDTCQGQALIEDVRVAGVTTLSSSLSSQMAKSIHYNDELGLSTSDRFSHFMMQWFQGKTAEALATTTLGTMVDVIQNRPVMSTINVHPNRQRKNTVQIGDFFANSWKRRPVMLPNVSYDGLETEQLKTWKRHQTVSKPEIDGSMPDNS